MDFAYQARGYIAAFLIVTLAAFIRFAAGDWAVHTPFITFYPAVMIAATYWRMRAGLCATGLSALIEVFFMEPAGRPWLTRPEDRLLLTVFIIMGVLISYTCEAMHRALERAKESDAQARLAAEREKTLLVLREGEEQFRLAVESAELGTWDHDLLTGAVNWSARCKEIFGLSPGAHVDYQVFLGLVHPDDRAALEELARSAMAPPGTGQFKAEYRIVRPDGTERWVAARGRALFEDGSGLRRPVRLVGTVLDNTERRRTEDLMRVRLDLVEFAATHSSRELLQKVLDEIGVLTKSPLGFLHFVEPDQKTLSLQVWSTKTLESCGVEQKRVHYSIDQAGVWVDCIYRKEPVIHNDYLALPHRKGMPEGHPAVIRELLVPIIRWDRVVAVLGIGNKPCDYTREDVALASYLADVAWEITSRKREQDELFTSRQMLQFVLDNIPQRIFWKDRDLRFLGCNKQLALDCGYQDPEDLVGKTDYETASAEIAEQYRADDRELMETGRPRLNFEERQIKPDGSKAWLLTSKVPMFDQHGNITGILGTYEDITERKRMEAELRRAHDELEVRVRERTADLVKANEKLREQAALLDLADDAIIVCDIGFRTLFWNKGAEKLYGIRKEDAIGKITHEIVNTIFPEEVEKIRETVLAKGHWEGELVQFPVRGQKLHTESRWALQRNPAGEPVGFLKINRDVTGRKVMEEQLRRANRALKAVNQCNAALVRENDEPVLLDRICRIIVETGGYRMAWVGYAQQDECKTVRPVASAGHVDDYLEQARITWADVPRGRGPVGRAIRAKEVHISKDIAQNPDLGPWRTAALRNGYASAISLPLLIQGEAFGALTIYAPEPDAFDEEEVKFLTTLAENLSYGISSIRTAIERKRADNALKANMARLERANAELQEFAFVASHDLQEPMRKVQTFADMAVERCIPALDPVGRKYLDKVIESAGRMRELLDGLLQFAQVAARPEPFKKTGLEKLVREAAGAFEEQIKQTHAKIEVHDLPDIEVDPDQLVRLFQHLIGNALKFRGERTPIIKVYGKCDGKPTCDVYVEDNGIGFDQQYAEIIFRPFQRLHGRKGYEGTGMGLSICRKIAERHGGSIAVESEPGKGSRFVVRLPREHEQSEELH